jgi:hypothetical protein
MVLSTRAATVSTYVLEIAASYSSRADVESKFIQCLPVRVVITETAEYSSEPK